MALSDYRQKLATMMNDQVMLGERGFLSYNANYRILICRECMYAVQKSALESHLLRHKIYRKERQLLLDEIARFDLLEPEDVPHPSPGSSVAPVAGLPIIAGLRCDVPECQRLLASSKQMKKHGVESHGINTPVESFAKEASLQTFFRGTKLRYFEVAYQTQRPPSNPPTSSRSSSPNDRPTLRTANLPTPASSDMPILSPLEVSLDLNLRAFGYFHQYHSYTSTTLPLTDPSQRINFWKLSVAKTVLKSTTLTRGLLAITAIHQVHLSQTQRERDHHLEQSITFQKDGMKEFLHSDVAKCQPEETACGSQIWCLIRCASWSIGRDSDIDWEPLTLASAMATIRACSDHENAFSLLYPHEKHEPANLSPCESMWAPRIDSLTGNHPPDIVQRLRKLPFTMAEVFSKPDPEGASDVLIILQTIHNMIDCCFLAFADDATPDDAWAGMVLWIERLPPRFHGMVAEAAPAAMVMMAYWSVLVRRAADRGWWFLQGIGERIYWLARAELAMLPQAYELVDEPDWIRCDVPIFASLPLHTP